MAREARASARPITRATTRRSSCSTGSRSCRAPGRPACDAVTARCTTQASPRTTSPSWCASNPAPCGAGEARGRARAAARRRALEARTRAGAERGCPNNLRTPGSPRRVDRRSAPHTKRPQIGRFSAVGARWLTPQEGLHPHPVIGTDLNAVAAGRTVSAAPGARSRSHRRDRPTTSGPAPRAESGCALPGGLHRSEGQPSLRAPIPATPRSSAAKLAKINAAAGSRPSLARTCSSPRLTENRVFARLCGASLSWPCHGLD
jgi:hypothetical protein